MSTVEGWHLDVYCDEPGCDARDTFGGHSRNDAHRNARAAGWSINTHKDAPADSVGGGKAAKCRRHASRRTR